MQAVVTNKVAVFSNQYAIGWVYYIIEKTSGAIEIGETPRKYKSISFVRCGFFEAFLDLQEQHGLKIHSESDLCLSELAEAVPAERESISFEKRVRKFLFTA